MDPVETVLAHHGVKGMKWGVRRKRSEAQKTSDRAELHRKVRKGAVITGTLLVAVGGVAITVAAKKHGNAKLAEKLLQESLKVPFQWRDGAGDWHRYAKEGGSWVLSQSETTMIDVEAVLVHHGVKGMKWGVRRDRSGSSGGSRPHPDAVKAKLFKEKVKVGSTDALSTDELRDLVNRLNLEKQFDTLKPPTPASRSKKILADVLLGVGKQQAAKALNDQASKQVTRLLANAGK